MGKYLNEYDSNILLSSNEINMIKSYKCKDLGEAKSKANEIGYPVVLKILSNDIIHKTDAGCVFINIKDEKSLENCYYQTIKNANLYDSNAAIQGVLVQQMAESGIELIIGVNMDPQFGHMLLIGLGGIYAEVIRDFSMRKIPVDKIEAEEMISETKLNQILEGARGKEYDKKFLIETLVKLSELIDRDKNIQEIDINPFFLYEKGNKGIGLDALIKTCW